MNLKIKNEWIDSGIYCPIRKVEVKVRMIEKELYQFYFNKGYAHIFDIEPTIKTTPKQTKPTDNDLLD